MAACHAESGDRIKEITALSTLVTALGIGLASSISGRNPMIDGFGLIAFASLLPIIFVLVYGILI